MKIENQVCGLEQAKRLQELGVNITPQYWWYYLILNGVRKFVVAPNKCWEYGEWVHNELALSARNGNSKNEIYPAYTVAELGEMVEQSPILINGVIHVWVSFPNLPGEWIAQLISPMINGKRESVIDFTAPLEAQARAAMLIYLLENKLIDVTQLTA